MNKDCLVPGLTGIALLLMSCQPVLPGEVTPTASPTPEPTPRQSLPDQPQTPMDEILKEPSLRYALVQPNRMDFRGGSGKIYTLTEPAYVDIEEAFVLMSKDDSICSWAGDEEFKAYKQLEKEFVQLGIVDESLVRKVMDRITSCVPFMEKRLQRRYHQEQSGN